MTSRLLTSSLLFGLLVALVAPACDSRPVESLPPQTEGGGVAGEGGARSEGGTSGHSASAAGTPNAAGAAGEPAGTHLELDEHGCPVIPYQDADGWACSDPDVECPGEPYDCGGGVASLLRCVDGFWAYSDDESDCLSCNPGLTQEGDVCANYEEGNICDLDGAGGISGDPCEFGQSLRCEQGEWRAQEAFPAPCGEGGAGGAP